MNLGFYPKVGGKERGREEKGGEKWKRGDRGEGERRKRENAFPTFLDICLSVGQVLVTNFLLLFVISTF